MVWISALLGAGAVAAQIVDLALGLGMWDETLAWILGGGAVLFGSLAAALAASPDRRIRRAWLLWAAGSVFVIAGAAIAAGFIATNGSAYNAAYAPWLGFAVCGTAGLAFRSSRGTLAFPLFLLDAIPLVLAAVAFIRPDGRTVEWSGLTGELAALAFPALFALLTLVATEVALLEHRRLLDSVPLAAAGFATMAAACIVWVSPAGGGFAHGQWADSLWTLGAVVLAAAGCRAGLTGGDMSGSAVLEGESGARAFLPLAGVAALGLMLIEEYGRYHALVWATLAAVVVLAARFVVSRRAADLALESERALHAEVEQARRQIAEQNDRLLELDRIKDALIASVSHELRTPLTAIRGYLEIVMDEESDALTAEQHELLGVVKRNAARLERIVNDLLFIAQSDAGKLVLEQEDVDLNAVAAESIAAAKPAAETKNIRLVHQGGETRLVGDRGRLAQVLDNLVSNAIKFTPDGGSVLVTTSIRNGSAVVSVTDTGMGMTSEEKEQLFDRFFRTDAASRQAIPGTGLGLSIVKEIVEAHGGNISVQSRQDDGTTFQVTLPLEPS